MKRIILLFFIYSLVFLALIALVLDGTDFFDIFDQGKRSLGLVGMVFLAVQFLLSSRISLIEQGLGQGTMLRYHRIFGILGLILVVLHGTLDSIMRIQFFGRVGFEFPYDFPRFIGVIATILLLVVAVPAMVRQSLKIPYQIWKTIHKVSYLVFPLVLIHASLLGTTIRFQPLAQLLWILCAFLYGTHLVNRTILWVNKRKHPYQVTQVVQETYDTLSIHAKGPLIDHLPGQFVYIQTKQGQNTSHAHPFTITSPPGAPHVRLSIKGVGDFTRTKVPAITKGDELLLEGPYGWFSHIRFPTQFELRFVAGGIGITPFVSILHFLASYDPDRRVTLIWGNKTPKDIGFSEELEIWLKSMSRLRIIHLFSETKDSEPVPQAQNTRVEYKTGFITQELLTIRDPNWATTGLMVCGPPSMMQQVQSIAKKLAIPRKHLLEESFTL